MHIGIHIGIHMHTADKCTLKSHGRIFGGAFLAGKNKELHGFISGEAYKREENYFGRFTVLLVLRCLEQKEERYIK